MVVPVQVQVAVFDAALDDILADVMIQLELVADDQTKPDQVVVFQNAQDHLHKLHWNLVQLDFLFFLELKVKRLPLILLPDLELVEPFTDLGGEEADVVNDFLDYLVLDLLVSGDEPHVFTSFYTAVQTQN